MAQRGGAHFLFNFSILFFTLTFVLFPKAGEE
jgi:hypothetical protein